MRPSNIYKLPDRYFLCTKGVPIENINILFAVLRARTKAHNNKARYWFIRPNGIYCLFSSDIIHKNTARATKGTHPYAARLGVFVWAWAIGFLVGRTDIGAILNFLHSRNYRLTRKNGFSALFISAGDYFLMCPPSTTHAKRSINYWWWFLLLEGLDVLFKIYLLLFLNNELKMSKKKSTTE